MWIRKHSAQQHSRSCWVTASISCTAYLSSDAGCRPSLSSIQPRASGEVHPVWRMISGWVSSFASLLISDCSPLWNWPHPVLIETPQSAAECIAVPTVCCIFLRTQIAASKWVSECWFMEAWHHLASSDAFKGTGWGQGWDATHFIGDLQTVQVAPGRISTRC